VSPLHYPISERIDRSGAGLSAALTQFCTRQILTTDDEEQNQHHREQHASDYEQPAHVRSNVDKLLLTS